MSDHPSWTTVEMMDCIARWIRWISSRITVGVISLFLPPFDIQRYLCEKCRL